MNASSSFTWWRARHSDALPALRRRTLWVALFFVLGFSARVSAQAAPTRIIVFYDQGASVSPAARARVESVLHASAAARRGLTVETSPVPFEDVAIATGCSEIHDPACGRKVAAMLDAPWLLVCQLTATGDDRVEVELTLHGAELAGPPRQARGTVAMEGEDDPQAVVPALFASLYAEGDAYAAERAPRKAGTAPEDAPPALQQPTASEPPAPPIRGRASLPLRVGSWTATVIGCSLLAAGATLGGISKSDHRDYAAITIAQSSDVDRARSLLDRAQARARRANALLAAGAVGTALGVAGLLFDWLRKSEESAPRLSLDVAPQHGGASVAVTGVFSRLP